MIDSTIVNGQKQQDVVLNIVKELKADFESQKANEDIRRKYEYYKKHFLNEKAEKDIKIKELDIYKEKDGPL
jgi:hypothetical protein